MVDTKQKISDANTLIQFFCKNIRAKVESLDNVVAKYKTCMFDLDCLRALIALGPKKFNTIIKKINNFDTTCEGDEVLKAFLGKDIQLNEVSLDKIVNMVDTKQKISDANTLIQFFCKNIRAKVESLDNVVAKYKTCMFDLDCLRALIALGPKKFNTIIKKINNFDTTCKENEVLETLMSSKKEESIKLSDASFDKVISMFTCEKSKYFFSLAVKSVVTNCADVDRKKCLEFISNHFLDGTSRTSLKNFNTCIDEFINTYLKNKSLNISGDIWLDCFNNSQNFTKLNIEKKTSLITYCNDEKIQNIDNLVAFLEKIYNDATSSKSSEFTSLMLQNLEKFWNLIKEKIDQEDINKFLSSWNKKHSAMPLKA